MIETTDDGVAINNDTKEGSKYSGVGDNTSTGNDFSILNDCHDCVCSAVAGGIIGCANFAGCCK